MMFWAAIVILPAAGTWTLIAVLRHTRLARRLIDRPNERSLHATPTPRLGGIGLISCGLLAAAFVAGEALGAMFACAAALALLSAADDARSLPIEVRLPGHAVAALVAVLALAAPAPGEAGLGAPAALVAVVVLVWMANLFNFMDGADGLAGAMAAIGFAALAAGAGFAGYMALAAACAAIASAALGFLGHNLPPAAVFLGDCGSVPLGFLAGALGVYGALQGAWPLWFPLLAFSPFIVDATLTVLRRLLRGERIWRAHRAHYYQRLVLSGWTHWRLLRAALVLMLAVAASALAGLRMDAMVQCAILVFWALFYALLAVVLERRLGP